MPPQVKIDQERGGPPIMLSEIRHEHIENIIVYQQEPIYTALSSDTIVLGNRVKEIRFDF